MQRLPSIWPIWVVGCIHRKFREINNLPLLLPLVDTVR
jgi:hypothetical protein